MRWLPWLAPCVFAALSTGCSGRSLTAPSARVTPAARTATAFTPTPFVTPSILLPDIPASAETAGLEPDGSRRLVLASMRLIEHPDGALERAPTLLPTGHARMLTLELPSRLGGGFLFVASSEGSAQLWRAPGWLSPLEPLMSSTQGIHEVLAGFDRVYVRHGRNGPLYGIDPEKGVYTDAGPLPLPMRIGPAHFIDGWRAVVTTDLRGALATFDAGGTWLPIGLRSAVLRVEPEGDDIRLTTRDESLLLTTEGTLTSMGPPTSPAASSRYPAPAPTYAQPPPGYGRYTPYTPPQATVAPPAGTTRTWQPAAERSLGARPLRLAIERGHPINSSRAVVAHAGALAVVDLAAGSIVELHKDVYPDSYSECTAIPLGDAVGFVCGVSHGATAVFRWEPPARLTPVMQWREPRAVFSSGNGSLVARAPCPGAADVDGLTQYCVRSPSGHLRELRFKGDLGAERVVAMADGRVAIIVAPRPGAEGRLVLLDGDRSTAFVLDLRGLGPTAELVRRGLWLHGIQEIAPGVLSAWVEAGGPVVGLRIDLQGRVTAGPVQKSSRDAADVIVSGRFALVWRKGGGHGLETTDGGATWNELELPSSTLPASPDHRSCSAVGCVAGGWMRVGWGESRLGSDLAPPSRPPARHLTTRTVSTAFFECEPTGRSSQPPAPLPKPPTPTAEATRRPGPAYPGAYTPWGYGYPYRSPYSYQRWLPFGPSPAPKLGPDEEGLSAGNRDYGDQRPGYRIYAWGPKSSEWTRAGHWLVRFDDPYDAVRLPASTSMSVSPWTDMASASNVLMMRSDIVQFDAQMRSGILGWCMGARQCKYYGIAPDESPVAFSTADPSGLPTMVSAVRGEDGWLILTPNLGQESELWQVSLSGQARKLRTLPRIQAEYGESIALVRRARSSRLGIFTTSPLPGRPAAEWLVLPVDPATGQLDAPVRVGSADLDGTAPPSCAAEQDGWVLETPLSPSPSLSLPGRPFVSDIRARLRADPGRVCLDGLAARVRRPEGQTPQPAPAPRPAAVQPASGVRLAAWDAEQSRKFEYLCRPRSSP